MKILLTGGRGMVGKNILEHPAAKDHQILAPTSAELDLRQRGPVDQWFAKHRPDFVIHSAGLVGGIQANINEPFKFLTENLDINRNLIGAAAQAGIPRLLNMGSSCMFPRGLDHPIKEEMILTGELEPTNEGYALAKIAALKMCEYLQKTAPQLSYKTLIPCNLYGRHDHFDLVRSHLIPAIILKIHAARAKAQPEVEIWGDGTARREFMDAADLADCVWACVARFDSVPQRLNVGLGLDHSVNEYYQTAADVIGYKGQFRHDLSRPVGMKRKLTDISRLQNFGWRPQSDLKTGLRKAYEFYLQENKNL